MERSDQPIAVKYNNQPVCEVIMERELLAMNEHRREVQALMREKSKDNPVLAETLKWSMGEKSRLLHEQRQQELLRHWRMRPTDRLMALLLYWVGQRREGGLLSDPVEYEEDAVLHRYLMESYWLASAREWDKAFSHLAEMGRLLGSATLETLDLNSLYWVDVEVMDRSL